jgi:hypothetical protein
MWQDKITASEPNISEVQALDVIVVWLARFVQVLFGGRI